MKISKREIQQIVNENIKEMALSYDSEDRPDDGIQKDLKNKSTTFKNVPLPNTDNENQNFQELLASERYKKVIQNLRHYTGFDGTVKGVNGITPLSGSMIHSLRSILQSEQNHREELSQLAVDLVKKEMAIPEGAFEFDAKIVDPGTISTQGFNLKDEDDETKVEIETDLMDNISNIDFEKAKRRFINSMIQGSSKKGHYMFHNVEDELKRITGNDNIINQYGVLMSVNDTMYWHMNKDMIKMAGSGGSMAGKVEVDRNSEVPKITATGVTFSALVHELIKGVMEIFAIQGRSGDEDIDNEVDESEDQLHKEVWDLRLGPAIWDKVRSQFPEEILIDENQKELQNYLLVEIFKLPAKKFFVFMKEVLQGTERGKEMMNTLLTNIREMFNDQDYDNDELENLLNNGDDDDEDMDDFLSGLGFSGFDK